MGEEQSGKRSWHALCLVLLCANEQHLSPLQVKVADRTVIVTTDAETRVAEPRGLQAAIDAAVAGVPRGRSFVRPSGTEDVVRVYAEAESQEAADALADAVARLVHAKAGGVGPAP